ncbi:MAG TPA: hypothetical protein VER11_08080 [Polyangiaceae bacterium]|nr:hypothetical protein [Polyangiaceae bacterium]
MARASDDIGDGAIDAAGANQAASEASPTEIVAPAIATSPSGNRLTRAQVAQRLGLSLSTVRRMEGVQLNPIVGEGGVHYFEETEIQTVLVRVRRTRTGENEQADGTLTAAAFRLFRNGYDVIAVVAELRADPETIEKLFEHWKHLRGTVLLDAKNLVELARVLGASQLTEESELLSAIADFKKETGQQCVLCEREPAYWCRSCAQELGRADALERESRKLY